MQFSLDFIHHIMSMTSTIAQCMALRTHANKFDDNNSGYVKSNVFIQMYGSSQVPGFDILPCLKSWDSYAVRLNGALRFGGFPLHWR